MVAHHIHTLLIDVIANHFYRTSEFQSNGQSHISKSDYTQFRFFVFKSIVDHIISILLFFYSEMMDTLPSTNSYFSPFSLHVEILALLKSKACPASETQPICLAGLPTTKAKSGTSLVTTAPAPMKAY